MLRLEAFFDLDNVLVIQLGHDLDLLVDELELADRQIMLVYHFDCVLLVGLAVDTFEHCAKLAITDLISDAVFVFKIEISSKVFQVMNPL